MKKLLLLAIFAVLLVTPVKATDLTGSINNPDGSGVTGMLYLSLSQQASQLSTGTCGGPAVITPTAQVALVITNGTLTTQSGGTPSIVGTDCLTPAGLYYIVVARDASNNILFTQNWQITGIAEDVGTILPVIVPQGIASIGTAYISSLIVTGACTIDGASCAGGLGGAATLSQLSGGTAPSGQSYDFSAAAALLAPTAPSCIVTAANGTCVDSSTGAIEDAHGATQVTRAEVLNAGGCSNQAAYLADTIGTIQCSPTVGGTPFGGQSFLMVSGHLRTL